MGVTPSQTLEEYALEWAKARQIQGGYLFAWTHEYHGKFCHVRRDTLAEVLEFSFHPAWVVVELSSCTVVESNLNEDVIGEKPASPSDDIPF